jgi:Cu/Zn superoxide dismutase
MDLPLLSEINTMKKEDLKNTLLDLIDYVKNAKKNDSVMLQILEEVKKGSNEREGLKEEMTQLKSNNEVLLKELADVKSHLSALHLHQKPTMENDSSPLPFFADAVKKSVHTALQEDKARCDVIISKVEEKGKDESFAADLCSKISYDTKPIGVMRLGRKKEDTHHHRLLKLSFSTNFEARAFRSRFEEARKDKPNDLSEFRVRPGRNREDQAAFRKSAIVANTLNKEAKHEGDMCSYSVRDNGSIWKFEKQADGKWVHISDWKLEKSGNDGR